MIYTNIDHYNEKVLIMDYHELIKKAEQTHKLAGREIVALLKNTEYQEELAQAADRVRQSFVGDEVHLRGLIEFSNICKQNCLYCGLRRDNKKVERYRLSEDEILDFAAKAKSYGYKTVVMQSGEDMHFSVEILSRVLRKIKEMDLAITLSIGEKTYEEYKAYKEAGADRYLIRIETTDKALYEALNPGMSFENRLRCLSDLKRLGYEVGTGSLVGLPNQTIESLAQDLLFFQEIDADMIGIGPFIPNGDTPLHNAKGGSFPLARSFVALLRLLLPEANIPATTAMETLDRNARIIALQSGANVVMPNVTEGDYRRKYALYPGKICVSDTPAHCRGCIGGKIMAIGRTISEHKGFRRHINSNKRIDC